MMFLGSALAEQEPRNGRLSPLWRRLSWGQQIPVKVRIVALAAALVAACAPPAWADKALDENLLALAQVWDRAAFAIVDPNAQLAAFKALERQAANLATRYPKSAAPLVWEGVVDSSEAGVVRGMVGFGLVKRARELFDRAAKAHPDAKIEGLLYSSLGELYYKVPGFPIGFGDNAKAKWCFERALKAAPDDIEVNYRYAEFLANQHKAKRAEETLKKALDAPPRPGREIGDEGFRREAQALLAKLDNR